MVSEPERVLCPYCGTEMECECIDTFPTAAAVFFCTKCGSCSPMLGGITRNQANERALSAALKRYTPPQRSLTVEELREMPLFAWAWIEILDPSVFERITYMKHQSAYCKKYRCIDETEFYCGYPGMGYAYYYCDYGKTWIAFKHEPTEADRAAAGLEGESDA